MKHQQPGKCLIVIMLITMTSLATLPAMAEDWLVDAPDEETRAERLSSYLAGFSAAMWEVGERYQRVVQAIRDENHELAAYHWEKIGDTIRGGYLKRPARQENADRMFLEPVWGDYLETLQSGDFEAIRNEFEPARQACMSCHKAEGVPFMNDQPIFTELGID